jgi:predicted dinucleotide-binding enzyme
MNITVIGRGHVGGGLARLWEKAGHRVTGLGREGGDASDAEVVVVAVPGHTIAEALGTVTGLRGQVTIDATNLYTDRDDAFPSLAHQVRSIIGGPTAKSFSTVFASAYDRIGEQRVPPGNFYAAEPGAKDITEQRAGPACGPGPPRRRGAAGRAPRAASVPGRVPLAGCAPPCAWLLHSPFDDGQH